MTYVASGSSMSSSTTATNSSPPDRQCNRDKEVKKDVTVWTVVTRSKKQRKRAIQIFVKVDWSKVTPMEVSLTDDKVEDVIRRIPNSEDVYVTMYGKNIEEKRKGEQLRSQ